MAPSAWSNFGSLKVCIPLRRSTVPCTFHSVDHGDDECDTCQSRNAPSAPFTSFITSVA